MNGVSNSCAHIEDSVSVMLRTEIEPNRVDDLAGVVKLKPVD